MQWYEILAIVLGSIVCLLILSSVLYRQFFKRFYDISFSGLAIVALSPLLLILTISGAIAMRGNPFFVQPRPGKISCRTGKEKNFKLIKFRTMSNKKDKNGELLPDEKRLNKYGKILRRSSLDELPELFNIFIGDMSIIGPRPWSVSYLKYYTSREHIRHSVRPGLSGYAQVSGRTELGWQERIALDLEYAEKVSLLFDIKLILLTVKKVLKKSDIVMTAEDQGNFSDFRQEQWDKGINPDLFYEK